MRRGPIFLVTALLLTGCGGDTPPKRIPAQACAQEWNQRAPASYRRMLADVISREGSRRVRVEGSVRGTAMARIGQCFVAQTSTRAQRNHVFIENDRGSWRLVHPRLPSDRGGPQHLPNLARRALRFANAWVGEEGQLRMVHRDVAPQIGRRPSRGGATAPDTAE